MENDYVKELQRALGGLPITGWFGSDDPGKVRGVPAGPRASVTGVAEKVMLTQPRDHPPGWSGTVRAWPGSAGDPVRDGVRRGQGAQRAPAAPPITGWFGPMTLARVKGVPGSHRLPVTGSPTSRHAPRSGWSAA